MGVPYDRRAVVRAADATTDAEADAIPIATTDATTDADAEPIPDAATDATTDADANEVVWGG